MIEPTDEMRMVAYRDAREWAAVHQHPQTDDRMIDEVLAAVLAVVARDRCMDARGHVYHPLAAPRVWDSKRRPSWTEGAPHLPDCPCVHCGIKRPDGEP